jgi:transcriptional regulator with XRE-family HTH domain
MASLHQKIGAKIKTARTSVGFSQAQLAERCSLATETVSRIERGAQGVGLENLAKLAEAMGSSLPKIVDVEGELEEVGALERDLRVAEVVRLMEAAGDAELDRVLRVVRAVLEG